MWDRKVARHVLTGCVCRLISSVWLPLLGVSIMAASLYFLGVFMAAMAALFIDIISHTDSLMTDCVSVCMSIVFCLYFFMVALLTADLSVGIRPLASSCRIPCEAPFVRPLKAPFPKDPALGSEHFAMSQ